MKNILVLSILFSAFVANAVTHLDLFAACDKAPSVQTQLSCQVSVVDDLIKKDMGQASLTKATKEAKASCAAVAGQFRLAPQLRLAASLECQRDAKIEFYNKSLSSK